ncbi:hypothetical protein F2Q70_00021979 [Brassica cretica]|uniref:Uncharacterized protein n=2 Tax=Brassica cretica TaxID=69181 RepID=A0A8S9GHC9_BRACR|nr:hypothetical protein F2Q70_00021979 [Brassica cretica]KAF2558021.1 hypothetical protein F2Q68_00015760 [Brassica cretica]KAF3611367.1 hypothetical protein DY000_02048337 [Brassica cretica]
MERSTENSVHVPLKDNGLQHQGTTEDKRISELESKVTRLAELLCLEEEKNMNLEENLTENHEDSDAELHCYCGKEMRKTQVSSPATCSSIIFVQPESMTASESMKAQPTTRFKEQTTKHDLTEKRVFKRGWNSCGREGHVARFYYERFDNIQRTWKGGMCYPEPNTYGCVWVPKSVLYARKGVDDFDDEFNVIVDISQLKDEGKVNLKHKVVE